MPVMQAPLLHAQPALPTRAGPHRPEPNNRGRSMFVCARVNSGTRLFVWQDEAGSRAPTMTVSVVLHMYVYGRGGTAGMLGLYVSGGGGPSPPPGVFLATRLVLHTRRRRRCSSHKPRQGAQTDLPARTSQGTQGKTGSAQISPATLACPRAHHLRSARSIAPPPAKSGISASIESHQQRQAAQRRLLDAGSGDHLEESYLGVIINRWVASGAAPAAGSARTGVPLCGPCLSSSPCCMRRRWGGRVGRAGGGACESCGERLAESTRNCVQHPPRAPPLLRVCAAASVSFCDSVCFCLRGAMRGVGLPAVTPLCLVSCADLVPGNADPLRAHRVAHGDTGLPRATRCLCVAPTLPVVAKAVAGRGAEVDTTPTPPGAASSASPLPCPGRLP